MIKRIQKIKNIGRFADCTAPGCEFTKVTIIFGFNTQGKSTLTAILRSIQTGNNNMLIGRKTFGATTNKHVEIDFDESGTNDKYVFKDRVWNKANPNILIFDSKFIAENVFDGESISFDQQKNLNSVIIGKKGQDLNNEIVELQKRSDDYASRKGEMTREFTRHFPGLVFPRFKALPADATMDDKIKEKDKEIKFELEKEDIKKGIKNHINIVSSFKFFIRNTLIKTLDTKQREIEAHIKNHFNTEENAQSFLSEGLDFLKASPTDGMPRTCVFCGQALGAESETLISIYSSYFKGGYEQLQKEVNEAVKYFKGLNIEAVLEKIAADIRAKDLDIGLTDAIITELAEHKTQFEKELDKKRDLNYAIDFDSFDRLQQGIEKIKADLEELETSKLSTPSPKTITTLEKEKLLHVITKKRHDPAWVKFCNDFELNETEAEKIRKIRDEKRSELEQYSAAIFDIHKGTINQLCKDMCADFELEDFKPLKKILGKDERIFAIKFFGTHKVSIENEDEKKPNFQNTLSESDKRLLAFAFFISLLSHDRELENKIIIFDDPMSSFDSERRRKTVHIITDLACKYREVDGTEKNISPKQKIILTHEDRFAKELLRLMAGARTLKIEEYTDSGQKRSRIVHADFSQDFPDDEIAHKIEKIKGILDSRTFAASFEEDCREVLEHIFKRKYFLELKDEISSRKSVRTFTTKLAQHGIGGFGDAAKSQKFVRVCDDLNIELHDATSANSNGDKESILNEFFECLKEI